MYIGETVQSNRIPGMCDCYHFELRNMTDDKQMNISDTVYEVFL